MATGTMEDIVDKLSLDKKGGLAFLLDSEKMAETKLAEGEYSGTTIKSTAKKLEKYIELINEINTTGNIPKDFSKSEFLDTLTLEIENTKKLLKIKVLDVAKSIEQEIKESVRYVENYFSDNMALTREAQKKAREEEEKLKRQEKSRHIKKEEKIERTSDSESQQGNAEEKEQALTENFKYLSFLETFKRFWKSRNDDKSHKKGFFSVLKSSYLEYKLNSNDTDKVKTQHTVYETYDRQCEIDDKIKKYEKEYESLAKQLKDMKKRLLDQGKKCLENTRRAYDEAVKLVETKNITEERKKITIMRVKNMVKSLHERSVEVKSEKLPGSDERKKGVREIKIEEKGVER